MFQVQCLKSTTNKVTESYSKYSIGPFIKGQSTTIGNALRRVLLSNLPGLAITGVRISGIDHEFSTIPNVKEDVVDILHIGQDDISPKKAREMIGTKMKLGLSITNISQLKKIPKYELLRQKRLLPLPSSLHS